MKCVYCVLVSTIYCRVFEIGGDGTCARCGKMTTREQLEKLDLVSESRGFSSSSLPQASIKAPRQ